MKTTPRDNEPRVPFRKPEECAFVSDHPARRRVAPKVIVSGLVRPVPLTSPFLKNASRVISRVNEIPTSLSEDL